MKKHFLAASLLLSAMASNGAGYQINLQGLRQLAMGGTGAGYQWDASTIFYNPAGLSRLKNIQVYACGLVIYPATAFGNQQYSGTTPSSEITKDRTFTPFSIYIGGRVQDGSKFALGLGIYTPFGNGLSWNDNWLGKYIVQSVELKTIFFQPTVSYKANEFISVGAGFIYAAGSLDLRQALKVHGYGGSDIDAGEAHLHGSASGVGYNLGVQIKPSDVWQFGLNYRSQVNMDIGAGNSNFTVPQSLQSSFPNTHFDTQLPMPQVATLGIACRPTEDLTLQFDLSFTGWNSFDSFRIDFKQHSAALQDMHAPRHYRNTVTPRIGGCYKINHIVSVMLGGAFDPTPVTNNFVSPDLPDADRILVTGGVAVKPLRGFTVLAAFEAMSSMKRAANYEAGGFSGTYQTQAFTPGIGIYYSF